MMDPTRGRIVINVSGLRFETFESTLARYPNTLLGSPTRREQYFDEQRREYFFDRNRKAFDAILFYYQSNGRLCKPENITEKQFVSELCFFEIGKKDDLLTFSERVDHLILADSDELPQNHIQKFVWRLFSNPTSSLLARLVGIIGISTLVLSILITCLESYSRFSTPKTKIDHTVKRAAIILNNLCYIWFTTEFVIRLICCASKKQFFKSLLNWIDLLAILPFYIQLIVESQAQMTPLSVLKVLRIFRIARILKVSRYSRGMRALIYTFYASRRELGLFFFILFISTMLSAVLTYYAEMNSKEKSLITIPEALWWSINTLTTVGYGDSYPVTTLGRALGAFFSVVGTILLGIPIFCLVSNFLELWDSIREGTMESTVTATSNERLPMDEEEAGNASYTEANECIVEQGPLLKDNRSSSI